MNSTEGDQMDTAGATTHTLVIKGYDPRCLDSDIKSCIDPLSGELLMLRVLALEDLFLDGIQFGHRVGSQPEAQLPASVSVDEMGDVGCAAAPRAGHPTDLLELGRERVFAQLVQIKVLALDQQKHGVLRTVAVQTGRLFGRFLGIPTKSGPEGVDLGWSGHTGIELLKLDLEPTVHVVQGGKRH